MTMNFRNKHKRSDYSALKSSSRRSYLSHKTTFSWGRKTIELSSVNTKQISQSRPKAILFSRCYAREKSGAWSLLHANHQVAQFFRIKGITNYIENHLTIWQTVLVLSLQMQQELMMHTGTQCGATLRDGFGMIHLQIPLKLPPGFVFGGSYFNSTTSS